MKSRLTNALARKKATAGAPLPAATPQKQQEQKDAAAPAAGAATKTGKDGSRPSYCRHCKEVHPFVVHTKKHPGSRYAAPTDAEDSASGELTKRRTLAERLAETTGTPPKHSDRIAGLLLALYKKRKAAGACMRCGKDGHLLNKCPAAKPPKEDAVLRDKSLW